MTYEHVAEVLDPSPVGPTTQGRHVLVGITGGQSTNRDTGASHASDGGDT